MAEIIQAAKDCACAMDPFHFALQNMLALFEKMTVCETLPAVSFKAPKDPLAVTGLPAYMRAAVA
jgi:hypothetical protein